MSEKTEVTNKIMKWANNRVGVFAFKHHGGPYAKVGTPDIILCIHGNFVAIECKKKGKTPTNVQILVMEQIRKSHGYADWFDNAEAAIEWLDDICLKVM